MPKTKRTLSKAINVVAADDDPIIRQLLETKLTALGCKVFTAEDGGVAWSLIRDRKPQLAIVDLDMPIIDGFSLIQCVRGHPRTKHMPLIVVTSRTDTRAIQDAFNAGATSFLTKPVHWSTFESHIRFLLRLTDEAAQSAARARRAEAAMRVKDTIVRRALRTCEEGLSEARSIVAALKTDLANGLDRTEVIARLDEIDSVNQCVVLAMRQTEGLSKTLCTSAGTADATVSLRPLLAKAHTQVGELSQARNVPIMLLRVPEDVHVHCDPDAIANAITQLLDNAVKFSPAGSTVTVEADIQDDFMLTITINDTGPGMEPDFFAACLAPFDRAAGDEVDMGGLGLPIVKAIIEAHGGVLEIRSMPGEGTTAMLVIPADRIEVRATEVA